MILNFVCLIFSVLQMYFQFFYLNKLKFLLSVAHWGHEAKHKLLKNMMHIGGLHIGCTQCTTASLSLNISDISHQNF